MKILLIIGSGGFLGSIARYLSAQWVHKYLPLAFPYGTMMVNIVGCLLIGVFLWFVRAGEPCFCRMAEFFLPLGFAVDTPHSLRLQTDNMALLRDSQFLYFALYTGLSVTLGLLATFIGQYVYKNVLI